MTTTTEGRETRQFEVNECLTGRAGSRVQWKGSEPRPAAARRGCGLV